MRNKIALTYKLRNMIMLASVISEMICAIAFRYNVKLFLVGTAINVLCFWCAYKALQYYITKQLVHHINLRDYVEFLVSKGSLVKAENATLFNVLLWLGDDDCISNYLKTTGLTIEQRIGLELYRLDKSIFASDKQLDYDDAISRIRELLELYLKSDSENKDVANRCSSYLVFYEKYLDEDYSGAISAISDISNQGLLVQWKLFHEAKAYEKMGQLDAAEEKYDAIVKTGGDIRFLKWLNKSSENNHAKISVAMIALCLIVICGAVISILFTNKKYDTVEEALKWQYGKEVSENNKAIDNDNSNKNVTAYVNGAEYLYCYSERYGEKIRIKKAYLNEINGPSIETGLDATSRITGVDFAFYDSIPNDVNRIFISNTDKLDDTFFDTSKLKLLDTIDINGKNYYLFKLN